MEHLYDTHYHLDLQENINEAVREIERNNIYTISVTNLPDLYQKSLTYPSSKYIQWALGFHPELIQKFEYQIPLMWLLLPSSRYIGEIGLDFCNTLHKFKQVAFFTELIERIRYDRTKIISIHSRRAIKDVLNIIGTTFRFKPILHWFSGGKNDLIRAIDNGFYFSINTAMIHSRNFKKFFSLIPSERVLLESDSPFIHTSINHSTSLHNLSKTLESYNENLNLWRNFYSLNF